MLRGQCYGPTVNATSSRSSKASDRVSRPLATSTRPDIRCRAKSWACWTLCPCRRPDENHDIGHRGQLPAVASEECKAGDPHPVGLFTAFMRLGDCPLVLITARRSCGCRAPALPRKDRPWPMSWTCGKDGGIGHQGEGRQARPCAAFEMADPSPTKCWVSAALPPLPQNKGSFPPLRKQAPTASAAAIIRANKGGPAICASPP